MKNFRTLELAIEFYEKAEALELTGNMRDQLHRAASSISLNFSLHINIKECLDKI